MKTAALVEMLARGAGPAPTRVVARRLAPAAAAGLAGSVMLALGFVGPIAPELYGTAAPWMKLAYAASLGLAAAWLTTGLARPLARLAAPCAALGGVFLAMVLLGAVALLRAEPGARAAELMGHSWWVCPWGVLALSLPALVAALWAARGLAPVRPAAAGFAAGLLAGALGAMGYTLACPEASPAFVALWYSAGIGLSGAAGALLGPRVLRW